MDATALVQADIAIKLHVACAVLALVLGTAMLVMPKGTGAHKAMGRLWIGLMVGVSLSSFFISEIRIVGPYSPIHLLSLLTLLGLWGGWRAVRAGDIRAHRFAMISVYGGGLIGAGVFTLVPGRIMHSVVFADGGASALVALVASAALLVGVYYRRRRTS